MRGSRPIKEYFLAPLPGTPLFRIGESHAIFYLCFLVLLVYLSVFFMSFHQLCLWTTLLLDRCLREDAPHLWWLLLPLLKLCPIKYQLVLSIMFWLIVMQETDIPVNTCYICHNYVHYLSLQVYQGSLS